MRGKLAPPVGGKENYTRRAVKTEARVRVETCAEGTIVPHFGTLFWCGGGQKTRNQLSRRGHSAEGEINGKHARREKYIGDEVKFS